MEKKQLFDRLIENLETRDFISYRNDITKMNEIDIAEFLEHIPPEFLVIAMRLLPKDTAIEVFSEFDAKMQETLITQITDKEVDHILREMTVDDLVDMLEELPAELVIDILE
ncbi:MAG TPA: hypothetical protein VLM88_03805 [Proteiniclasticum sp.]|nr:hypothetical protein [Proteiniclasticum sp.]